MSRKARLSWTYHTPSQGACLVKADHVNIGNGLDLFGLQQINLLVSQHFDTRPKGEDENGGQAGGHRCYEGVDHPLEDLLWAVVELASLLDVEAENAHLEQQCEDTVA